MTPRTGSAPSTRLRVRLFGRYRDWSVEGDEGLVLEIPAGGTVADLVAVLRRTVAGPLPDHPVVAVNHRPVSHDTRLEASDEVALIPPVAGG